MGYFRDEQRELESKLESKVVGHGFRIESESAREKNVRLLGLGSE